MLKRSFYIYSFGQVYNGKTHSVDFYNCKSGKDRQYVNARNYWVTRLQNLTVNAGCNYFVEK